AVLRRARRIDGRPAGRRRAEIVSALLRGSASAVQVHLERDEAACGDAAEQVLARLAGADEDDEQLLPRRRREVAEPVRGYGRPPARPGPDLAGRELLVRRRRLVDECAHDRAAAAGGDVETEDEPLRATPDRRRGDRLPV